MQGKSRIYRHGKRHMKPHRPFGKKKGDLKGLKRRLRDKTRGGFR